MKDEQRQNEGRMKTERRHDGTIKDVWGDDFFNNDDFCWGFYKLDESETGFSYMVIVDEPINPIAYLLDNNNKVDPIAIRGDGVMTDNNVYYAQRMYDCDEKNHLDWYSIFDGTIDHFAQLE